ncbi:discoidin domain-containing protein [Dolosigranulum pigrum]|uniref:discoidin domain-containing protein n=1 Tax=Dolosigranulum pigrum TaxID=29394 RepID=UPI001AD85F34|nr:discoidin domain-containing protein [Dolosigranulum pigrum]QTJ46308.1 discoidin domain-containing protein [Dolosigranulum pigrum]
MLSRVELTKDAMEDPAIVKDAIESVETNSQELNGTATEGPIELAFDHDKRTIWHSKWGEKEKDYTVNIALKEKTNLTGLAYIPRQDKSNNGNILTYEVYVEKDNELVKVAEGNWENSKSVKYAKFENTIETTKVQLKVLKGEKGFASAAAIQLLQDIEIAPIFEEEIIAPEKSDKPGGSSDSESSSSEGLITQKEEAATQIGKLSALRVADINKFIVAIALADTVEEINEILQRAIELNDQLQEDIEERNKTDKGEGIVQPEKPKFEGGMNGIGLVNEKPEFPSEEIERLLQVERDNASRYIATLPNLDNSRMKEFQVMIKEAKTTLVIEEVIKEAEKLNNKLGQLSSEQSTESEETPKDQSDTVEATFAFTNNDGSVHRGSLGKFANLEQAERRIRQYANELGFTLQSFHLDNGTFLAEVDADFSQPLPAPEQPEETPAPKAEAAFEFVLENGSVHRGSLGEFTSLEQAERRIRHFANEQGYTLQNFRIEDGKFLASVKEMDK